MLIGAPVAAKLYTDVRRFKALPETENRANGNRRPRASPDQIALADRPARQTRRRGSVQERAREIQDFRSNQELFREERLSTMPNCVALSAQHFLDDCVVDRAEHMQRRTFCEPMLAFTNEAREQRT